MHGVDVGLDLSASTVRHLSQFTACPVCCLQDWHGVVLHSVFDSIAEVFLIPMGPPAVHSMGSTGAQTNSTTHRGHLGICSACGAQTHSTASWHRQMTLTDGPTCANSSTSSKSPGEQSAGRAIWQGRAMSRTAFCPWGLCSMKDWATCNAREHLHITYLIDE